MHTYNLQDRLVLGAYVLSSIPVSPHALLGSTLLSDTPEFIGCLLLAYQVRRIVGGD